MCLEINRRLASMVGWQERPICGLQAGDRFRDQSTFQLNGWQDQSTSYRGHFVVLHVGKTKRIKNVEKHARYGFL